MLRVQTSDGHPVNVASAASARRSDEQRRRQRQQRAVAPADPQRLPDPDQRRRRQRRGHLRPARRPARAAPRTTRSRCSACVKAGTGPVDDRARSPTTRFNTKTGPVGHFGYYTPGTKDAQDRAVRRRARASARARTRRGAPRSTPAARRSRLYGDVQRQPVRDQRAAARRLQRGRVQHLGHRQQAQGPLLPAEERRRQPVVPNAYVFAFEEFNAGYDSNDIVGIIRNVPPGRRRAGDRHREPRPGHCRSPTGSSSTASRPSRPRSDPITDDDHHPAEQRRARQGRPSASTTAATTPLTISSVGARPTPATSRSTRRASTAS